MAKHDYIARAELPGFFLWEKAKGSRQPLSFDLELTARCNNNCRHCYINLPAGDSKARRKELSFKKIKGMIDEATDLGAIWCLLTGGEPLLREDFFDIYLYLKKKGCLVSLMTNATLVTRKHVELFKKYPPRDIEVTVYGVTQQTYERVSRKPGSFSAFMRGTRLLLTSGIKVRFKAVALRSNLEELPQIAAFCRKHTKDNFRFDPFLVLRYDKDEGRNEEIKSERLSPEEIVELERRDPERFSSLQSGCHNLMAGDPVHSQCNHVFHCGAGMGNFVVGYDGTFKLCSSLVHPDCTYDLRTGSLGEAWWKLVPRVRDMRSGDPEFQKTCRKCPVISLCMWCPANAYLETGRLDKPVESFCRIARSRQTMLRTGMRHHRGTATKPEKKVRKYR